MKPILWAELPITNLVARRDDGVDVALLPVGGTSPHGPHLPTGTDSLLAETLCHAISSRTGVPVLPTISFGVGLQANAITVSPATLTALICDTLEAALTFGMRRVIVLSGSGDNLPAIECALQTLRARHPQLLAVAKVLWDATPQTRGAWHSDARAPHAGLAETALLQYLAPHLVHVAPPDAAPSKERVFPSPGEDVCGSPCGATAELGAELFEALVAGWTHFVKRAMIEGPPICGPPLK